MIMAKFLGNGKGADVKIEGDADVVFTEISCAILAIIDAASEEAAKDGVSREKMLEDVITSIYKISKKNLIAKAIRLSDGGMQQ